MNVAPPTRPQDDRSRPPLRILVVRTGAMGDILHGMPAIAALRSALPNSYIGWAAEPHWIPLLQTDAASRRGPSMPLVDRVHHVPTREWKERPFSIATLRQIAALRRELRAERYDVCVDLQGSIRSAFIGRMSGSTRFLGPRRPRERQARALYGERVGVARANVIDQACELIGAAARLPHLTPAQVLLPHDPAAVAWCDEKLGVCGISGRFVLLAPGAGWGAKRWPAQHFVELTRYLRNEGFVVLTNYSEESSVEPALAAAGAEALPSTLPQLIELARRASVVIGGDTGPMHLAAALGRPVVALFGPTDPLRNGPEFAGARTTVLRHPSSVVDHRRHTETELGLAQITVAEVLAAARQMLECQKQEEAGITTQGTVIGRG